MKKVLKKGFIFCALVAVMSACHSDLDLLPEDERESANVVFDNPASYKAYLAKIYGGISLSGQIGPAGSPDLVGLDEGFSNYLRLYWSLQQLPTEESIIGWDDGTLRDLHYQNWTSGNEFIRTMYTRIFYQVALINEFLRQTTDDKLNERGVDNALRAEIQTYRAEARFMRALSYWHALDLYRNTSFVTEEDPIGAFFPRRATAQELFDYIESELIAVDSELVDPRQNEYGRADKAAAWMLLAKLYLNADTYVGQNRYADVIIQTNKIFTGGYAVSNTNEYIHLFFADNDTNGTQNEIIFPVRFNGTFTQSFGGMTFLVNAALGGTMNFSEFGTNGGWGGLRTTSNFVELFPGEENSDDNRAQFWTNGHTKQIISVGAFTSGYAVKKFRNIRVDGTPGANPTHPDTDFPMFRLADAYLMYAEAHLRGGGGSLTEAVNYINILRQRAYGSTDGNISSGDLTLDFVLDERSRELYWEAHRRTDLVRYGRLTSQGVWDWKGRVPQGMTTPAFRDVMPIPFQELSINPNLIQNPGY